MELSGLREKFREYQVLWVREGFPEDVKPILRSDRMRRVMWATVKTLV